MPKPTVEPKKAEFEWYDYRAIFSRGALWNLVVGARSVGKTYAAKRDAVKLFIATGEESIWVRRTLTELRPGKANFFGKISKLWPGFDFRVDGDEGQIRMVDTWQTCIRFVALSVAEQSKGTEFQAVTRIYYDECMVDPDLNIKYLEGEIDRLRSLWVTVGRERTNPKTGRSPVTVILMGNVYELDNPWFLEWDFVADKEWQRALGGEVVLHLLDAKRYETRVGESVYGKVLGTKALNYGGGDYFRPDGGYVIPKRDPDSKPFATLVSSEGTFGLWVSRDSQKMFVTRGELPTIETPTVAFEPLEVRPGVPLSDNTDWIKKETRRHYRRGSLFFVTPSARRARKILAR